MASYYVRIGGRVGLSQRSESKAGHARATRTRVGLPACRAPPGVQIPSGPQHPHLPLVARSRGHPFRGGDVCMAGTTGRRFSRIDAAATRASHPGYTDRMTEVAIRDLRNHGG